MSSSDVDSYDSASDNGDGHAHIANVPDTSMLFASLFHTFCGAATISSFLGAALTGAGPFAAAPFGAIPAFSSPPTPPFPNTSPFVDADGAAVYIVLRVIQHVRSSSQSSTVRRITVSNSYISA